MLVRGDWGLSYGKRGDCCQDPKVALCGAAMEPKALALLARRSPTEQYSSPLEPAGRGSKMSASLKVCLKGTAGPACLSGSLATWKLFYEGHGTAKGLTVEKRLKAIHCSVFRAPFSLSPHCCQPWLSQGPQCLLAAIWGSHHSVGWSPSHLAFVHLEVEAWPPHWGLYRAFSAQR